MADYVDDSCNLTGKTNSCSDISLSSVSFTQTNHPPLCNENHSNDRNAAKQQLSDIEDLPCLLAFNSPKTAQRNDAQNMKEKRQLIIATTLCFFFMFAEILGGYFAGSLAIMTDAAHLLSDCISFIVALLAICLSKKSPDNYMTFGYKRFEVLGAILSIFGIWLLTTFLFYFALNRLFYQDFNIDADTMMIVSAVGIVINIIMALILHGDGLSCFAHSHHNHHHQQSGHHHSPKHEHKYHNNNKTKNEYQPLINETSEKRCNKNLTTFPSPFVSSNLNRAKRSSSIGSYSNHSRSNSFSRSTPFGSTDAIRRNSHVTAIAVQSTAGNKIKDINDLKRNDCVDVDLSDDKVSLSPSNTSKDSKPVHDFVGAAICPIHQYVHRDSSENTPITSDSEDAHDHHRRRTNYISSQNHHSNTHHSHDFSSKNINIQAAVIHVLGDFIQSIGVFISAIIIKYYPNAKIADPLCTFIFSIIVMVTTCNVMKDSMSIILEAVPNSINTNRLADDLNCIGGVKSIHNLNIWSLTVGWNLMSVHIIIDPFYDSSDILDIATTIAQKGYNIKQCTIQIEQYRESKCDEQANTPIVKTHSITTNNEHSIINMLT